MSMIAENHTIDREDAALWTMMVSKGISNSLTGLSKMLDQELRVHKLELKRLSTRETANLVGGLENQVVGIYLSIEGDATGHLMLIHDPKVAFEIVDMQMGLPAGSTSHLEEMERSVLGEMGNVTGAFFLNALADCSGLTLMPSPPSVVCGMAGSFLSIPMDKVREDQKEVLVIKATYGTHTMKVEGTFIVLPSSDFMQIVLSSSRQQIAQGHFPFN